MTEEPCVRIVFPQGEDDTISGVTIYVNAAGRLELLRALATLHPGNRHVHLERLLTLLARMRLPGLTSRLPMDEATWHNAPPTN
jgi:hypothetical protein